MSWSSVRLLSPEQSSEPLLMSQLCDVLTHLDHLVDLSFQRIVSRVERNQRRVQHLRLRLNEAHQRVAELKELEGGATLPIASKLPDLTLTEEESIFPMGMDKMKITNRSLTLSSAMSLPVTTKNRVKEKLHFYHVSPKSTRSESPRRPISDFTANLVLFNTTDLLMFNPSSKETMTLNVLNKNDDDESDDDDQLISMMNPLDLTQLSFLEREAMQSVKLSKDELDTNRFFSISTDLNEMPKLDLPEELDLPNLAMHIVEEEGRRRSTTSSLAPSHLSIRSVTSTRSRMNTSKKVNELSTEGQRPKAKKTSSPASSASRRTTMTTSPSTSTSRTPSATSPSTSKSAEPPTRTISSPPPPPPPPPPPSGGASLNKSEVVSVSKEARSSLLAAIREAGGAEKAGLRSVKNKEEEKADLMSDLSRKLSMRRQGISGTAKRSSLLDLIPIHTSDIEDHDDEEKNTASVEWD